MTRGDSAGSPRGTGPGSGYAAVLRAALAQSAVGEELFPRPPSELELQSDWFAGAFGRVFRAADGREIEIVEFGTWNRAAGPDFTGAVVRLDGELLRGEIELDPDARDWERHGHGENPVYDGVVLHVFLEAPRDGAWFTRTSAHRQVCQLHLPPAPGREAGPAPPETHAGRCAPVFEGLPDAAVARVLEGAAQFRLRRKLETLERVEAIHGAGQALYLAVAEALGYRRNQLPLRVLAQQLPLRDAARLRSAEREALLFGLAGFLDAGQHVEATDPDKRAYQRGLWSVWWKRRGAAPRKPAPRWTLVGVRPVNHPQRRVAALAVLAGEWDQFRALVEARPFDRAALEAFCTALRHPFWSRHYTLRAAPSDRPLALLGEDRARDLLANAVYPLLLRRDPSAWTDCCQAPGGAVSAPVRQAALRHFGADTARRRRFTRLLVHQQGLLQLERDFCLASRGGCGECPFPERLRRWAGGTPE